MLDYLVIAIGIILGVGVMAYLTHPKKLVQAKRIYKKCTKEIYSVTESLDIGRTQVSLVFENGKKFNTFVYGKFTHQNYDFGRDESENNMCYEPYASKPYIESSRVRAQDFVSSIHKMSTVVDDPELVTESRSGKVVSAEIVRDMPFEKEFSVYKTRDKK